MRVFWGIYLVTFVLENRVLILLINCLLFKAFFYINRISSGKGGLYEYTY